MEGAASSGELQLDEHELYTMLADIAQEGPAPAAGLRPGPARSPILSYSQDYYYDLPKSF